MDKVKEVLQSIGWGVIVVCSSLIWFPISCYNLGLVIADNIRAFYTTNNNK